MTKRRRYRISDLDGKLKKRNDRILAVQRRHDSYLNSFLDEGFCAEIKDWVSAGS